MPPLFSVILLILNLVLGIFGAISPSDLSRILIQKELWSNINRSIFLNDVRSRNPDAELYSSQKWLPIKNVTGDEELDISADFSNDALWSDHVT